MAYSKLNKQKIIDDYKNGVNLNEISLNRNIPKSRFFLNFDLGTYEGIKENASIKDAFLIKI